MAIPVIDNPEDSFNYQPERSGFVISLASCLNAFTATLIALFLLIATVAPCSAVQVSTSRWESAPEYIGARWHPHSAHPNWYAYAGGDPVNRMDPSGLDFINVGINSNGDKDDDAVLWLSDDADGTSIGNLTKGGKANIGRLDPADRSMVMLMGGTGRVPLASLQRLAEGSHFLGHDGFGENVDQSIGALQIAIAAAQNFQPGTAEFTGDEDPVDLFLAQRGRDFAWGVDAAHALQKDLAIALLTIPGGPVDAALGKTLGVIGNRLSAWRTARMAKNAKASGVEKEQLLGAIVPKGSPLEATRIGGAFTRATPAQQAWYRKFAAENGIQITEGALRNEGGRLGNQGVVRLTGRVEDMDKRVLLEELQHAIDGKNGIIGTLENATRALMNKRPNLSYAQAAAIANESMHMGTFRRLVYNSGIPSDVLSDAERVAIRMLIGE